MLLFWFLNVDRFCHVFTRSTWSHHTRIKQKENTPQCPWWRSQSNLSNYIGNISRAFKRHHPLNCRFFFLRSNKIKEIVRNQPSLKQSAEWINKVTYLDIEDVSSFQVQCPALNWRRFLLLLFNTLKILVIGQLAETFRQKRRILPHGLNHFHARITFLQSNENDWQSGVARFTNSRNERQNQWFKLPNR